MSWLPSWSEIDPATHPFDPSTVPAVVRSLGPATQVPAGTERTGAGIKSRLLWTGNMTAALNTHYGPWSAGWRLGLPVRSWCCINHSMTSTDAALDAVAGGLVEWRAWLEELAGRFASYLPLAATEDWEFAVTDLVTLVVERTGAEDAWYGQCTTVLGWFLDAAGVPSERHEALLADALGGRFESWIEPSDETVAAVATRLARDVAG